MASIWLFSSGRGAAADIMAAMTANDSKSVFFMGGGSLSVLLKDYLLTSKMLRMAFAKSDMR